MSEPLSWQPPRLYSCEDCPYASEAFELSEMCWHTSLKTKNERIAAYFVNHKTLTPSCPAWQDQQKEKTE